MSMQKELNRGTLIGAPTRPKQLAQEKGAATALPLRRTGSSNPLPSSSESAANRIARRDRAGDDASSRPGRAARHLARQLLVARLAAEDHGDDAEHGKAGHDPGRVGQPAEL